jgi:hypothetical protein
LLIHVKNGPTDFGDITRDLNREVAMRDRFRVLSVTGLVMALLALVSTTLPSYADTGTVRFRITKVGFIVGVGGGTGVLHFRGHSYRLRIDGVSAGTIGVASADLVGTASNLRTAADIAGSYSVLSASIAVAGGGKAARLQNARGVVLDLQGAQVGFELSFSLSGATISFQ